MKFIVGLGNPGKKYENNRHNVGFLFLDEIQKLFKFSEFKFEKKFNAEVSEGILGGEKITLLKPQTFMNNSGQAVRAILDFYKLSPSSVTVVHDDLDIEVGTFKTSEDSRAAGHNGIQNIFDHLETQKIKRIRIGVEKEGGRIERNENGVDFVLKDFTKEELEKILSIFQEITKKFFNFSS